MERYIHLSFGTKAPTRLNIELKYYGRQLYEIFTDNTA